MGDRAQIQVQYHEESVYLYSHWDGYRIRKLLADALRRGESRWGDAPYLSRIIFCEMVKEESLEDLTGFGIWSSDMDGFTIQVNVTDQTVLDKEADPGKTYSFQEYVDKHSS